MEKIIIRPQEKAFNIVKKLNRYLKIVTISSSILTIINPFLINFLSSKIISNIIMYISIALIIAMAILAMLFYYFKSVAETERQKVLIDNSFGTKLAKAKSINYYDTEDINQGHVKLLANIHESCLYTNKILGIMLKRHIFIVSILFLVLLYYVICGMFKIAFFETLLQIFLSSLFSMKLINIFIFYKDTKDIENQVRDVWDTYYQKYDTNSFIAKAISISMKYECSIFNACLLLNEKIYEKIKNEAEVEWLSLRDRYKIKFKKQ